MGLRAFSYARASRDPRYKGSSVADQETDIERECERNGWTIVRQWRDLNRSASRYAKKTRDDFDAMVDAIRDGQCDVVVAWESSRLQRDLDVYVQLRRICAEAGVLWSYNGVTYDMTNSDDRLATGLHALIGEHEADEIRARVLRTTRLQAERGLPHGRLLYGYAREYDPATGDLVRQVLNPAQAEVVREAGRRVASGEPPWAVARDLNRRGILTSTGKQWDITQITRMVRNPAYVAKRVHQGRIVADAKWPPILDESTWYACRRRLADPARRTSHDSAVRYLLSGIAVCAVCAERGEVVPLKVQKNRGFRAYLCPVRFCVSCRHDRLDEFVVEVVIGLLSRPETSPLLSGGDGSGTGAMAEVDRLTAELDEFVAEAIAGRLSAATLARIEAVKLPQIEAARRRAAAVTRSPLLTQVTGPDARERWEGLVITQQRELVSTLMEVRLGRTRKGARTFDPNRVQIIPRSE